MSFLWAWASDRGDTDTALASGAPSVTHDCCRLARTPWLPARDGPPYTRPRAHTSACLRPAGPGVRNGDIGETSDGRAAVCAVCVPELTNSTPTKPTDWQRRARTVGGVAQPRSRWRAAVAGGGTLERRPLPPCPALAGGAGVRNARRSRGGARPARTEAATWKGRQFRGSRPLAASRRRLTTVQVRQCTRQPRRWRWCCAEGGGRWRRPHGDSSAPADEPGSAVEHRRRAAGDGPAGRLVTAGFGGLECLQWLGGGGRLSRWRIGGGAQRREHRPFTGLGSIRPPRERVGPRVRAPRGAGAGGAEAAREGGVRSHVARRTHPHGGATAARP
jgi:hypothetical protein